MSGFTKTAIMDAFLQLLDEMPMERITVQDIVQRCGVSRNTFYYHYGDVYALLEATFRRDIQRLRDARPPGEPALEGLQRLAERVKARQRVFAHIYSSVNHDFLQRFLFQATEEVFMEYIQKTAQGRERPGPGNSRQGSPLRLLRLSVHAGGNLPQLGPGRDEGRYE